MNVGIRRLWSLVCVLRCLSVRFGGAESDVEIFLDFLLPVVTDAPWQIIDKKKEKEVKMETTSSIQSGFVAAKGSVPIKSEQKQKLGEAKSLSASVKKTTGI
jgi:hypothetical protein